VTESLQAFIENAGPLAPFYYILSFVVSAMLPFIPTPLIGAVGGTALGFMPAVLYGILGLGIGAGTALGLSRIIGRPLVLKMVRPEAWERWEELLGIRSVYIWGIIFFVLNLDFAVVAAGLTSLPVIKLWLAAIVARLPWLIASALFGEAFFQNDALFIGALLGLIPFLFILSLMRPRIQRWLVAYADRRNAR